MLAIPDSGLQLESSAKSSNFLPLQAFGISLDDNVIEDMIKCVRDGDQIELSLGNNPVSRDYHRPFQSTHYVYYSISKFRATCLLCLDWGPSYITIQGQPCVFLSGFVSGLTTVFLTELPLWIKGPEGCAERIPVRPLPYESRRVDNESAEVTKPDYFYTEET